MLMFGCVVLNVCAATSCMICLADIWLCRIASSAPGEPLSAVSLCWYTNNGGVVEFECCSASHPAICALTAVALKGRLVCLLPVYCSPHVLVRFTRCAGRTVGFVTMVMVSPCTPWLAAMPYILSLQCYLLQCLSVPALFHVGHVMIW